MKIVADIETNRLDNPDKLWCIVARDVDTNEEYTFIRPDLKPKSFQWFMEDVELIIGHNFLSFDLPNINKLVGMSIPNEKVLDTLLISRCVDYNLQGGHSLAAWGQRFGEPKDDFKDFENYSQIMLDYCKKDVIINVRLWKHLERFYNDPIYKTYIDLQHEYAPIVNQMKDNGFYFNIEDATVLLNKLTTEVNNLREELQVSFPPRYHLIREITPSETKAGTVNLKDFRWLGEHKDLTPYSPNIPFSLVEQVPFNPGSPKQRVQRLNEAGWKPFEKTKGHIEELRKKKPDPVRLEHYREFGWTTSEDNLATLPKDAPEGAQKLSQWMLLDSRRSTLEEWSNVYNPLTHRIHGTYLSPGCWTQRLSHSKPNQANIPTLDKLYGKEFRSYFTVPKDRLLVGVDAEGIQLRIFAHYTNDDDLIHAIVSGRKEDGTDAHSYNMGLLSPFCKSREVAKTFIYAWLLGAGIGKIAHILSCTYNEAMQVNQLFLDRLPFLKKLKQETIPLDAKRGGFFALDGHLVKCNNSHLMLAGYLQSGESLIMTRANIAWYNQLKKEKVPFWQVNFVHDEWQTETLNNRDQAEYIAHVQIKAIEEQGKLLKMNCPLAGSYSIGTDWSETH